MMNFNEEHNDLCVGIDLGTTNSVLATINTKPNGDIVSKVVDLPRAVDIYSTVANQTKLTSAKKPLIPSCVYYREEQGYSIIIGDFAKMQYALRPHLVAKSIKSQMGENIATGLSPHVPDRSPAQISARILQHMLQQTERIYGTRIDDAVITVPANFDSTMCKATRDAAALAGIKIVNKDGSERPILLSEPNAVIYDLINQIHNGEISDKIIDLEQPRNVLVFDLGGGTLDITLHKIKRRNDAPDVLKVDEIATNRYTLLGGDDFDNAIAEKMYERYLQQYSSYPEILHKLKLQKNAIMPQLKNYAETVKLELSANHSNDFNSGWDADDVFDVGGNVGATGYAYDDIFTKEELEEIIAPLMGYDFQYSDYQNMTYEMDTNNIIYPILDVLSKASAKLNENVKVDYVVVNGGMSKFYLVTDRLAAFFGAEPICVLDPDQAVARGAAVYHYYLHKYQELQDDMRILGDTKQLQSYENQESSKAYTELREQIEQRRMQAKRSVGIEWGSKILNDAIYLGVRYGGVLQLAAAGAELPCQTLPLKGFKILPAVQSISLPIKVCDISGTYRTIAACKVALPFTNNSGCFISLQGSISEDKTLSMVCIAYRDAELTQQICSFDVIINVENSSYWRINTKQLHNKILMPNGSALSVKEEIHCLLQFYTNILQKHNDNNYKEHAQKRVEYMLDGIKKASNKKEFTVYLMDRLEYEDSVYMQYGLLSLIFQFINELNYTERANLARICREQLSGLANYKSQNYFQIQRNIQALKCLKEVGNENDMKFITSLAYDQHYYSITKA